MYQRSGTGSDQLAPCLSRCLSSTRSFHFCILATLPLPAQHHSHHYFSYFPGRCTEKLAAIRTSNVSDLTNQRASRSSFGRTRFPHLCSLLHVPGDVKSGNHEHKKQLLHEVWIVAMGISQASFIRSAFHSLVEQFLRVVAKKQPITRFQCQNICFKVFYIVHLALFA